jgi:probable HAF family extracellular repeat protein
MTGLGTLGGPTSIGRAINESGQIVGDSSLADSWLPSRESHAFLHDPIGGLQDIGIPGKFSVAYDINDLCVVAGQEYEPSGINPPKAFIYDQLGGLRYLDDLIGPNNEWVSFRSATGINNHGQIVGTGLIDGEFHIFLATPVPEPSALGLMLLTGMFLYGIVRDGRTRRLL